MAKTVPKKKRRVITIAMYEELNDQLISTQNSLRYAEVMNEKLEKDLKEANHKIHSCKDESERLWGIIHDVVKQLGASLEIVDEEYVSPEQYHSFVYKRINTAIARYKSYEMLYREYKNLVYGMINKSEPVDMSHSEDIF